MNARTNYVEHVSDDFKGGRCVSCFHWSLKGCNSDADEWKEDDGKCNVNYLKGGDMEFSYADGSCDLFELDMGNRYAVAIHNAGYPTVLDPTTV